MSRVFVVGQMLALSFAACCAQSSRAGEKPKPAALTAKEIADGWISLFDGETTFGWKIDGDAKLTDGVMNLGGDQSTTITTTTEFSAIDYKFDCRFTSAQHRVPSIQIVTNVKSILTNAPEGAGYHDGDSGPPARGPIAITCPANCELKMAYFKIKPRKSAPLFNGKDLTGWKPFTGDPKREKSKFSVTPEGWLNVTNGPGDLQTDKQFADFVLQAECISHGQHLNSGIFFRALPGQYQQGYEAQIHNGFKDGDRSKPIDFGTGAIYRRAPARKVVSNDNEWFTMTVAAHGNHIATWVNGYQTTDFTDTRPAHENARNGSKTGAGAISIQGHDPTTNLSFRNIRIAELGKK